MGRVKYIYIQENQKAKQMEKKVDTVSESNSYLEYAFSVLFILGVVVFVVVVTVVLLWFGSEACSLLMTMISFRFANDISIFMTDDDDDDDQNARFAYRASFSDLFIYIFVRFRWDFLFHFDLDLDFFRSALYFSRILPHRNLGLFFPYSKRPKWFRMCQFQWRLSLTGLNNL